MYGATIPRRPQAYRATGDPGSHPDCASLQNGSLPGQVAAAQPPVSTTAPEFPFFWGREPAGWWAGWAEPLNHLPRNHPKRAPHFGRLWQDDILLSSKYQDSDGMWHQLIDHPESYQESSGGHVHLRDHHGVKKGWLRELSVRQAARKRVAGGHRSSTSTVTSTGLCFGTGQTNSLQFYGAAEKGNPHARRPSCVWRLRRRASAPGQCRCSVAIAPVFPEYRGRPKRWRWPGGTSENPRRSHVPSSPAATLHQLGPFSNSPPREQTMVLPLARRVQLWVLM